MKISKLVTLLTISSSFLLGGCGQNETNSEEINQGDIVWAGWSGEEDATSEIISGMIDSFNQSHDAKVSWVGWPWADTQQQLIIRNQGSEILDVAQVDIGMFGALSEMDVLVDFNDLLGKDYLKENYESAALDVGNVDGKQLGMPWSIASIGMLYNPEILAAVGYNSPPVTIAEFEDCLAKIKAYDPTIIPYGLSTKEGSMATDFQPWLWTFGANIISEDGDVDLTSKEAIAATEWYKGLLSEDYIQMNITRFDARQMFAEGKMAFYDDAISARGIAEENGIPAEEMAERIQPMSRPVLNAGDEPQSAMWGHLLVVFKKSKNQETAAELVKHIVSEEQSLIYLENNGMPPVIKSAVESDAVKSDSWIDQWLDITETGRTLEFALNSNGGELNNILVEELQAILGNEKDVEKGLADAKLRIEQAQE